ncbi:hypothetical protein ACI2KR_26975 [Pseudomonas luteola]
MSYQEKNQTVIIDVSTSLSNSALHPDDIGLPGIYEAKVDAEAPEAYVAQLALEAFNTNIPVSVPEDFDIVVKTLDGQILDTLDNAEEALSKYSYGDCTKTEER